MLVSTIEILDLLYRRENKTRPNENMFFKVLVVNKKSPADAGL